MIHIPVMLPEVLTALAPRAGATYLDATFGGGGYASAILEAADCTLWAIDRDPDAIARGAAIAEKFPGRLHLLHGSFASMLALLADHGVTRLDGVVMDLGLSSFQIDDPARGFSFRTDGPLDMRMDRAGPTAADLVATLGEAELADTLYELGEERLSRRIAKAIVAARAEAPITTTAQLAGIIRRVVPKDASGIDPATRSFQALRIRGERRTGPGGTRAGPSGVAAEPRRAAGGGVVPFRRGPVGEAVHDRRRGSPASPLAPRPARPVRSAEDRFPLAGHAGRPPHRRRNFAQSSCPERPVARA